MQLHAARLTPRASFRPEPFMFPASFGYVAAHSVNEALELVAQHGEEGKILAGGHSLIPAMKLRLSSPRFLIDIGALPELRGIKIEDGNLVIGAMTVHADIAGSDLVRKHVPGLADAAVVIGDLQVRNRGTIGGSVAHADPGADFPVILTALNASFIVQSGGGARTIAVDDFFTDFFSTALNANEILTEIRVPLPDPGTGTAYAKFPHPASGYVVVSAGALIARESNDCAAARIAVGGLGATPARATATEQDLQGKPLTQQNIAAAAAKAAEGTDPVEDSYASAEYKRHVATAYARQAMETAAERASRPG
jgi:carbon-monoxide dehydrogenase medium subunit